MNNKIRKLISGKDIYTKINSLKNLHIDKECVILSCGPSISKYKEEISLLKDKIIICVKQSIHTSPYCNYHLLNFVNDESYSYVNPKPITFYISKNTYNNADFNLKLDVRHHLYKTKEFDKFLLEKTLNRPWGPGIMYELAFYLAHHIGCKKVTTYGWDADLSKTTHFYKNGEITSNMKTELNNAKLIEKDFVNFFIKKGMSINIKR
jgi:hypothetical protein